MIVLTASPHSMKIRIGWICFLSLVLIFSITEANAQCPGTVPGAGIHIVPIGPSMQATNGACYDVALANAVTMARATCVAFSPTCTFDEGIVLRSTFWPISGEDSIGCVVTTQSDCVGDGDEETEPPEEPPVTHLPIPTPIPVAPPVPVGAGAGGGVPTWLKVAAGAGAVLIVVGGATLFFWAPEEVVTYPVAASLAAVAAGS